MILYENPFDNAADILTMPKAMVIVPIENHIVKSDFRFKTRVFNNAVNKSDNPLTFV
jgi:hypothetical protein